MESAAFPPALPGPHLSGVLKRRYKWRRKSTKGVADEKSGPRPLGQTACSLAPLPSPIRRRRLEHLSFVYDHSQGKTVPGYEILARGLLPPRNFYPENFGHHFSRTVPNEAPKAKPRRTRGDLARRLK